MRKMMKWTVIVLACTVLVIGCGDDKDKKEGKGKPKARKPPVKKPPATQPAVPPTPKPTPPTPKPPAPVGDAAPKAALLALVDAMEKGDGAAVANACEGSKELKDFLKAIIPGMAKIDAFVKAGNKTYGAKAWKAALTGVKLQGLAEMKSPFPAAAELAKTLKITVEGDKATATWQGAEEPFKMVKKGDAWLVVPPPDTLPPAEDRAEEVQQFTMAANAAAEATKQIGKPGVTAERAAQALADAIKKAGGEGGGEKPE